MPIYEFVCCDCDRRFEALVSIGKEHEVNCGNCGGRNLQKCVTRFGIGGSSLRTGSGSADCSNCSSGSCSSCR